MKRTGDMSPLKCIRLRSHEGENEGETDRCVLESGDRFVDIVRVFRPGKKKKKSAASCLVLMSSQTSVSPHSQGAQTPYHWLCLLAFHCNNHNCYFAFEPARGITARLCARKGAIRRPAWLHNRAFT